MEQKNESDDLRGHDARLGEHCAGEMGCQIHYQGIVESLVTARGMDFSGILELADVFLQQIIIKVICCERLTGTCRAHLQ